LWVWGGGGGGERGVGGKGGSYWTQKCVFLFSPQLLSEPILILRRTVRIYTRNITVILLRLSDLIRLEFFSTDFRISKFHENPSSDSWFIPCGQTDRDTNSYFQISMRLEFFSTDFRRISKFHENPSSGSWVIPCGQTDRDTNSDFQISMRLEFFSTDFRRISNPWTDRQTETRRKS